ncbi:MAG: DNA mismatch repair protein MutS [bacterium]
MSTPKLTPMLQQFLEIKKNHTDCILFFRMGDFYEMFGDDAVIASKLLDITLTSRQKSEGNKLPMCGVPHHAAENYIAKLVKLGHKVAICDQVEDPKTAKGIVRREVVQIVTPGTLASQNALEAKTNQYIAAIVPTSDRFGLAFVDSTTGEFSAAELETKAEVVQQLWAHQIKEVIIPDREGESTAFVTELKKLFSETFFFIQPEYHFAHSYALSTLTNHFATASLHGFGLQEKKLAVQAAGGLLSYLTETQKNALRHITSLRQIRLSDALVLDQNTLSSLEILSSLRTTRKEASLLGVLDHTQTAMGGRLLKKILTRPLIDVEAITKRQDAISYFIQKETALASVREQLHTINDLERLLARLSTGKGNAIDLNALANSFTPMETLRQLALQSNVELLHTLSEKITPLPELQQAITTAIKPEPAAVTGKGNMIADGYNGDLDELRSMQNNSKEWVRNLQLQERETTGINSLKVGYNGVFGYYIEVSAASSSSVPDHYIRKQTLANAERFITPELKEYEAKILGAEERIITLENQLFQSVVDQVLGQLPQIQENAEALAYIDVLSNFAFIAQRYRYIRPEINDDKRIEIIEGRHPVVEQALGTLNFIPNDTVLDSTSEQIMMITGPNMAGKSTYIRQVALLTLLAQTGSFIPAKSATIGIVDRIFTRIGASDNVAEGQSTFMVEMFETANILNNCTDRSLLILDEIGRGTSTVDGLSIAWAILEYLHGVQDQGPRTLFATHYHELIQLADQLPRLKNYNVMVKEEGNDVIFLHKITLGGLDKSYGIHVARLAGVPKEVLERAKQILVNLEESELTPEGNVRQARRQPERDKLKQLAPPPQMDLFG